MRPAREAPGFSVPQFHAQRPRARTRRILLTPPSPEEEKHGFARRQLSFSCRVIALPDSAQRAWASQGFLVGIWGVAMQVSLFMIAYAGYWTCAASQTGTPLDLQTALHKRERCIPYPSSNLTYNIIHPSRVQARRAMEGRYAASS